MIRHQVVVAARAENQIRAIDRWWRANRPDAPDVFTDELNPDDERVSQTAAHEM